MITGYLLAGTVLLVSALLSIKLITGRHLASATFVLVGFYFNMFLDLTLRIDVDPYMIRDSLSFMIAYNLASYFLLVSGLITYYTINSQFPSRSSEFRRKFLSSFSFSLAVVLIFVSFIILMVGYSQVGRFDGSKGQFSYGGGGTYRTYVMLSYVFYALVPALFISAFVDSPAHRPKVPRLWFAGACLLLVAVFSISQFGRQTILFVMSIIAIIYVDRIKRPTKTFFMGAIFGVISVTALALLRKARQGLSDIDLNTFISLLDQGVLTIELYSRSLATIIPGQAVFSNIVQYVASGGHHFYGITYVESMLSSVLPDTLIQGFISAPPATWYKNNFYSDVKNHGFDFGMVAESYMNFSYFGVLLFYLIGVFTGYCSKQITRSRSPLLVMFSALMVVNIVVGLRNDSNAFFTRAIWFLIPFAFLYYLPKMLNSRRAQKDV